MAYPKIIWRYFLPKLLCEYTKGNSIGSSFSSITAFVRSRVGLESSVLLYKKIWQDRAVSGCKRICPNASDTSAKIGEIVKRWLTVILLGVRRVKSYDLMQSL